MNTPENLFIKKVEIDMARSNVIRLSAIVEKDNARTNEIVDETLQLAIEIFNQANENTRKLMMEQFESLRSKQIGYLTTCIQEQDVIIESIDEQLRKESNVPFKNEDAILQVSELKNKVLIMKELNEKKIKDIREIC